MKKYIIALTLIIFLSISSAVLASDISNSIYFGQVRVTNNGTATNNVSGVFANNSTAWISAGFMNATATDIAIRGSSGVDKSFMPGYADAVWSVFVDDAPAGNKDLTIYTNATDGKIRYFPDPGGMTTADSVTLEGADNVTYAITGFLNTDNGSNKNILRKPGAIRAYVSDTVSENITVKIGALYSDDFEADGWTDNNAKIVVNTGNSRLEYEAERSANDDRTSVTVTTSSDDKWALSFTYHPTLKGGTAGIFAFGLFDAAGNVNGFPGDAIVLYQSDDTIDLRQFDGGVPTNSSDLTIVQNTTYYVTLERQTNVLARLSIFTDSNRGTHMAGSPVTLAIPATVTALDTIQGTNFNDGNGAANEVIGWIDDLILEDISDTAVSVTGITSDNYTTIINSYVGLEFDGINDSVNAGNNASIIITGNSPRSGELWFITTGNYTDDRTFIGYGPSAGVGSWLRFGLNVATGRINLSLLGNDNATLITPSSDEWHHIAFTLTGTTSIIYLDGGVIATKTDHGVINTNAGTNFYLGRRGASTDDWFQGSITEVRWYNRVLTPTEVLEHSNGFFDNDSGLVGHWQLNEGVGTTALDSSDETNTGTISGAAWSHQITSLEVSPAELALIDGIAIPDTSFDYVSAENGAMTYLALQTISINNTAQQSIEWQYGTTFDDGSGQSHDATPTFRTTSSDADVTIALISFGPLEKAEVDADTAITWPGFGVTQGAPDAPGTTYTENTTPGIFFAPLVHAIWNGTGAGGFIPVAVFWYWFAFFFILFGGIVTYWAFADRGQQALLIKIIVMLAIMTFWALPGPNIYGLYVVVYFVLWSFGILVLSKSFGW